MFSHRLETSVLVSMDTSLLTSVLHQIMINHGWQCYFLSFDPGSSLIPAATATINELHQMEENNEEDDEETAEPEGTVDPAVAAEVVQSLRDRGFQLMTPRAKASWR